MDGMDSFNDISIMATAAVAVVTAVGHVIYKEQHAAIKRGSRGLLIRRRRISMSQVYQQLGDRLFRRAYRMTYETFTILVDVLRPYILKLSRKFVTNNSYSSTNRSKTQNGPNGIISPSVRLGCALRYFAGGSPYDLITSLGIGYSDVFKSVWIVVEATNQCNHFDISFPTDHDTQQKMAEAFKNKSSAGFDCCVGAVDGILIWINRPKEADCNLAGCKSNKFFCGRKHKFGLNCQAICDANGRFLDISILYPGSTSDILSFESSTIYKSLQNGLLAPGLCLFGDNAYTNTNFMATPFSGISGGSKDAYNFYHSQLRINIECAFGKLVQRWGILRAAIPLNISIGRTTALCVTLAKLHNFCLDHRESSASENLPSDTLELNLHGAVPLQFFDGVPMVPALLGGGHHHDDVPQPPRCRRVDTSIPRFRLHESIQINNLSRPTPNTTNRRS